MSVAAPSAQPRTRLAHLDALRGLAAVVVVVHHALLAGTAHLAAPEPLSVWNIVLLGRPAVILFFVLSGFVLTLHLTTSREGVLGFAVRRLARLLPPYAAATGIAAALFVLTGPHGRTGLSDWFDAQWSTPLGASDLLRHFAMLAGSRQFPLDHVAWSLVHEVRLSLALPLFLLLARRWGLVVSLAAAGTVTLLAGWTVAAWPAMFPTGIYGLRFDAEGLGPSLVLTARFCLAFALGAVLALQETPMQAWVRRPAVGLLGLATGLTLLSCRDETLMALGATALVGAVAWTPCLAAGLSLRALVWVGRLSFSLYLLHLPIMLACVYAGRGCWPPTASLAIGGILAFPLAAAMAHLVEPRAIGWSRAGARIVSRWGGRASWNEGFVVDPR